METTIKELKRNDQFIFNDYKYLVLKKYRNDNYPLKALNPDKLETELFHNEDLIINKI